MDNEIGEAGPSGPKEKNVKKKRSQPSLDVLLQSITIFDRGR